MLGIFSAKYDVALDGVGSGGAFQPIAESTEVFEKIIVDGGAGFDFDGGQLTVLFDEQIYLGPPGLTIVKQAGMQPVVNEAFVDFGDNPAFEDSTPQWMQTKLFRFSDTEQVAHQSAVKEMQLGCLDDLLADVLVLSRKTVEDIAGFKNRNPGACRIV